MAVNRADISNTAIRLFLQRVGTAYDKARGFEPFKPSVEQWRTVLEFFDSKCCYCGITIAHNACVQEHLIPTNKTCLGLHSWGNVVPCCGDCNKKKHYQGWEEFLRSQFATDFELRRDKICMFVAKYRYKPNLELFEIAKNLYQDVGAVAETLIDLRYRQAEELIAKLHAGNVASAEINPVLITKNSKRKSTSATNL